MFKDWGAEQYYEDFAVGDRFRTDPVDFSQESIIGFAQQYDPQRFHIDPEAAKDTMFGGLIASGWQVVCETFKGAIDAGFLRHGGMSSPGIDRLRWLKPVRPDDKVHLVYEVTEARPSRTRNDRGYVTLDVAAINQRDETVMTYSVVEIVLKRSVEPG